MSIEDTTARIIVDSFREKHRDAFVDWRGSQFRYVMHHVAAIFNGETPSSAAKEVTLGDIEIALTNGVVALKALDPVTVATRLKQAKDYIASQTAPYPLEENPTEKVKKKANDVVDLLITSLSYENPELQGALQALGVHSSFDDSIAPKFIGGFGFRRGRS